MIVHRRTRILIMSLAVIPFLVSCGRDGTIDPMDRQGLTRDDFRDMYDQEKTKEEQRESGKEPVVTIPKDAKLTVSTKAPPIPEIASILAAPRPPKIGQTKLVSISVTDDVPLKDVFVELSRLADVDIELDSGIEGGITFRAKERPFNEVVERIAGMAGLRYSYKDGVLRVERDLPYVRNYTIDFLNITRDIQSTYNISTDVSSLAAAGTGGGGGGGGSGGGGLTSGSSSSIKSNAEDDFWKSFESSIGNILASSPPKYAAMNPLDPRASTELGGGGGGAGGAAAGTASLPQGNSFNINRKAGVISISATERQHEKVKSFIEKIRQNSSAQVLIEAKILEVSLNDQFESGINWDQIQGGGPITWDDINIRGEFNNPNIPLGAANPFTTIKLKDKFGKLDLDATIRLLEKFGTVRTLSSPRLSAINNQPAVLTFAKNQVYFDIDVDVTPPTSSDGVSTTAATTSVNSEIQTVPIGVILNLIPSIDLDDNEVTLNVRPTLTRIVGNVTDPALPLQIATLGNQLPADVVQQLTSAQNQIPIVEVRELDSIMKIKSGQVMVIGGLMEDQSTNSDQGVPFASDVPIIGNFFKRVSKQDTKNELVIFIKATIVSPNGNAHEVDKNLYNKFTTDPRPLAF
ncbi:MAG: hypothetical protein U1E36_06115 [Rickettsiales bacterium]